MIQCLSVHFQICYKSFALTAYLSDLLMLLNHEMLSLIHLKVHLLLMYSIFIVYFWLILAMKILCSTTSLEVMTLYMFAFAIEIIFHNFLMSLSCVQNLYCLFSIDLNSSSCSNPDLFSSYGIVFSMFLLKINRISPHMWSRRSLLQATSSEIASSINQMILFDVGML